MLPKQNFDGYLGSHIVVMREMMRIIALRQVETNLRLARGGTAQTEVRTRAGRVYTVFSPRGGSGKTTVAVNLAVLFALLHPEQIALLDLCLTFGHCALALNLVPKSSLGAINHESLSTMDRESLGYYLVPHERSTLKVMVGANKPEEGEAVDAQHVKAAVDLMKRMYEVTIIDAPSNFNESTIAALEVADKVLMLCSPDLVTLRDVRECQRIFNDLIHLSKTKLFYIMNHVLPHPPVEVEQFEQALEQEMHAEIPFGGDLPSHAAVRGEALAQTNSGSNVAKALDRIAKALEAEVHPQTPVPERRGLFGRG
jgi:pilus assembly protein CpaE